MSLIRPLSLRRLSTWLATMLLILPLVAAGQNSSPSEASPSQTQNQNSPNTPPETEPVQTAAPPLPDSPDTTQNGTTQTQTPSQGPAPSNAGEQVSPQQTSSIQKPLGTAAAGVVDVTGVAASRPVGAALAPTRQRRVHLLIIKLGIVAAGAVALGATLALTAASPSRPPGNH